MQKQMREMRARGQPFYCHEDMPDDRVRPGAELCRGFERISKKLAAENSSHPKPVSL